MSSVPMCPVAPMMKVRRVIQLRPGSLALLEDRILMRTGKKQKYGSQVTCPNGVCDVYPIEDPDNVNKRRASVGLEPIEDYLMRFGIEYKGSDRKEKQKEKQ